MLRVVLVDDEPSVLEGLRIFVNWNELGFEIVGEAQDGVTSFSVIRETMPDLVICDIRMPGLNGLELIERVNREINPAPKFILLSGYNDFTYAQKALQLGTLGYLTKPLDSEELENELMRVSGSIESEKNSRQEYLELIRYTANQLYIDIMDGKRSEKLRRKASFLFDVPENSNIRLLQFIADSSAEMNNTPNEGIYNMLSRLTGINSENCIFYNGSGSYIVVIHNDVNIFTNHAEISLHFSELINNLNPENYGLNTFWVLITNENSGDLLDSIYNCGKELEQLQTYCMLHSEKRLLLYGDFEDNDSSYHEIDAEGEYVFPELPFDKIINSLKGNDITQVKASIDEFFSILNQVDTTRRLYSICLYRLADLVRKMAYAFGIDANNVILKFTRSIDSRSPNCKKLVLEMCNFIFKKQNINNQKPLMLLENEIIEYIKENYRESLSLQGIAEKFSLSPIIISKIVKKKTGQKFNDYFNYLRIEYAKMLIASANIKITAICEQAGYSDYSYFSEKFKEFTGVSPSEYKKKYS